MDSDRHHALEPVWFEEAVLKLRDFEAERYVNDLSLYVPLETICSQLETHLKQLKEELVEAINDKYHDFVGLGHQLSGVEGAIVRMAKPLATSQSRLGVIQRGIQSEWQLLQTTLDHRRKIKEAKEMLETLQKAVNTSNKIDKLMREAESATDIDPSQNSAFLERTAREIGRLMIMSNENQSLSLIKELTKKLSDAIDRVRFRLITTLKSVLTSKVPDHAAVVRLLNALSLIDATAVGEDILKDILLKPIVEDLLEASSSGDMASTIERLLERYDDVYGRCFEIFSDAASGLNRYDFVGGCLLSAFHDRLSTVLPSIFTSGHPEVFLDGYKASLSLIDGLEKRCPSLSVLERFRTGSALDRFTKAWRLEVYFALRFREIAGALDNALKGEQMPVRGNRDGYIFASVSVWMQCLQQCSNPQIVTEQLADQFLKLFFKLLSRFERWLVGNIEALEKTALEELTSALRFPRKNEDLVLLERDLSDAQLLLDDAFYLTGLPSACHEDIRRSVTAFGERLNKQRRKLIDLVGCRLVIDCGTIVKKSVGAAVSTMFRPTGDRPTVPNDYVQRLLEPLHFFLQSSPVVHHIQPPIKQTIKHQVAEGLCLSYKAALLDRLSFWEKSRMSLRRFNKGKLSQEQSSDSKDELGNIYHQHWLDINTLGQILKDMDITDIHSYQDLRDLIISKKEDRSL